MDNKLQDLGYALNPNFSFNDFDNLGRTFQVESQHHTDTMLRLHSPVASGIHFPVSKLNHNDGGFHLGNESHLVLKLSHQANSSVCKDSSAASVALMKEIEKESSEELGLSFNLYCGNGKTTCSHTGTEYDLELSLTAGPYEKISTLAFDAVKCQNSSEIHPVTNKMCDEGEWPTCPPRIFRSVMSSTSPTQCSLSPMSEKSDLTILDSSMMGVFNGSVTCTSGSKSSSQLTRPPRSFSVKNCQYEGCLKGARGASGLCIAHGGGRRCQKLGCNKGAEGSTVFCKAHGGGRRCHFLGCTKSAEGRIDYCIAHGGGRRCISDGCVRAARGKSGLCISHGGGKRCQQENCTKSAEGLCGLCISHGGGRRCQYPTCLKGAQGSTMFCKAHGGGKRCSAPGCTKGAEGSTLLCKGHGGGKRCSSEGCAKSVHGGTLFCVAHGGGKRCTFPECTKSARGRTNFCVRHGGGKRCKLEGCGKSAQGSTDLCKAHGGGKRCSLSNQPQFTADGQAPCDRFASGKSGLCSTRIGPVQDTRVYGGVTLGKAAQELKESKLLDIRKAENIVGDSFIIDELRYSENDISMPRGKVVSHLNSIFVPDGRVHGGSLLASLASVTEIIKENVPASGMTHEWI